MPFRLVPARDRKLYRLVKDAEARTLSRGTGVFAPGDEASRVFLVRQGLVKLSLPGLEQGSAERAVTVALPWEIFGEDALTGGTRRYAATVVRSSDILALPASAVLKGLRTASKSLAAYLQGIEVELHRLRHCQAGSRGPDAAQKLAEVLLDLGERCGDRAGRRVRLAQRFTHQLLADLSGSHRATVTTLLNDWLYEGHLDSDSNGHLILTDRRALLGLAGYHAAS